MHKSLFVRIVSLILVLLLPLTLFAEGGRTPLRAQNGIVASASRLASEIGVDVLRQGGNAIDAAVATALAMAVTWPEAGNIGGGGFLVYHGSDGHATTFDFREKAPLGATERMYQGADGLSNNMQHRGFLSVGVPGTVAGLYLAHQRLGSLPWADLVEPSVQLAREGIPITWDLYTGFQRNQAFWEQFPSSAQVFLKPDGSAYRFGDQWVQPDLARTLERIRDQGHDGFYRGENARMLASFMQANGGLITEQDLALYQAVEREPVRGNYRGYDVISMPPPSSGGIAIIQMLNILEAYDLAGMGHNSAQYLHVLTESMRRAFASRAEFIGDPDFNPDMPVNRLLSKEHAASLRATIDLNRASVSDETRFAQIYESDSTTHFSVVDKDGNMVSLTYTLENSYGSRIVAEGGGYLLNNEMGDFNPVPGVTNRNGQIGTPPNLVAPQKRMLSSMSPTIIAQDGKPLLAIGSPGGRTIINTTLQVILNMLDHGMNVAQAVEAGRMHHQWLPDQTRLEGNMFSPDTLRLYEAMGHTPVVGGGQGSAMGVFHDRENGLFMGAADSRDGDGAAVGY
jgi:gamma-glutamyltranspeptidase/glutathione hydrolase